MEKNEKQMVPKLRFPGFTDPWEQRKFGDIAERSSKSGVSNKGLPAIEYEDVISGEGVLNRDLDSKLVNKTGKTFNKENILYGKLRPYLHNWLLPDFNGIAVGDWWVLKPIGVERDFLYQIIQSELFDAVANQSTGTKMPRADWKLVANSTFGIPVSQQEQKLISGFFKQLDKLLTLHQR